jgi:hypothetical protein
MRRRINDKGYVDVWAPSHPLARRDGYVSEHRLVMHEAGAIVTADHDVHHINEVRHDNRIENLVVLPHGVHHAEHLTEWGKVENQFGVWPILRSRPAKLEATIRRLGHGHDQAYSHGCRCEPCREAHRARHRRNALVRHEAAKGGRTCSHCGGPMPVTVKAGALSCSPSCATALKVKRNRAKDPATWPHGKLSCYTNYRCRCEPCVDSNRAYLASKRVKP